MQVRPKKAPVRQEFRPLTQEELLAEAAQTEIENTASVQVASLNIPPLLMCLYCVAFCAAKTVHTILRTRLDIRAPVLSRLANETALDRSLC